MWTESTTQRTCVHHATESLEETKTHQNVDTIIDFCIPWECAKLAIFLIIIKEELRSKEKSSLLLSNLPNLLKNLMIQRLTVKPISPSTMLNSILLHLCKTLEVRKDKEIYKIKKIDKFWSNNSKIEKKFMSRLNVYERRITYNGQLKIFFI